MLSLYQKSKSDSSCAVSVSINRSTTSGLIAFLLMSIVVSNCSAINWLANNVCNAWCLLFLRRIMFCLSLLHSLERGHIWWRLKFSSFLLMWFYVKCFLKDFTGVSTALFKLHQYLCNLWFIVVTHIQYSLHKLVNVLYSFHL